MASSYSWADALTVAKPYVSSIPTTAVDVTVADQLNSYIWKIYPWRWAQFSLTSASGVLNLVDGVQDYALGTTTGGGFKQLLRVRITRTDVSPVISREKDIVNWLAPNLEQKGAIDAITAMCYEPVSGGVRLDRAASVSGSAAYRVDGEYWFQPARVTSTSSVIVFPDQYFDVVIEGLKWKYYQLGNDKREPDQRTVFLAMLAQMVKDEDYGDAPGTRFPADSLGWGKQGNPGLWGYY
jgi:hypothetical protein